MKNAVFWDVTPCRSCVNRRFGGTYHVHLRGRKIRERGTNVAADVDSHKIYTASHPRRRLSSMLHLCNLVKYNSTQNAGHSTILGEVTVRDLTRETKVHTKTWRDTDLSSFLSSDGFVQVVIQILYKDGYADIVTKYTSLHTACPTRTVFWRS
jgi:hypothetical protein